MCIRDRPCPMDRSPQRSPKSHTTECCKRLDGVLVVHHECPHRVLVSCLCRALRARRRGLAANDSEAAGCAEGQDGRWYGSVVPNHFFTPCGRKSVPRCFLSSAQQLSLIHIS